MGHEKRSSEYKNSKIGVVSVIYSSQKQHSKHRGHPMPSYTKKELKDWLYSQKKFHELYDVWKANGYEKDLKPSCDRLDDYKPYTLDNLQITTWRGNYKKVHRDKIDGVNNKQSKAVLQFTLDGNFIAEYHSMNEAERQTGISHGNISSVCTGLRNKAGGFVWKYKQK